MWKIPKRNHHEWVKPPKLEEVDWQAVGSIFFDLSAIMAIGTLLWLTVR